MTLNDLIRKLIILQASGLGNSEVMYYNSQEDLPDYHLLPSGDIKVIKQEALPENVICIFI